MWQCVETRNGEMHVVPEDDEIAHWPDGYCLCMPSRMFQHPKTLLGRGAYMVVHNSYDGREAEEGPAIDTASGNLESWVRMSDPTTTRTTRSQDQARH